MPQFCFFLSAAVFRRRRRVAMAFRLWKNDEGYLRIMQTRRSDASSLFGQPAELPWSQLPTAADVGRCFAHYKKRPNMPNDEPASKAAKDIISIWSRASLPHIQLRSVTRKILQLVSTAASIKRGGDTMKNSRHEFERSLGRLFDVSPCSCDFDAGCTCPAQYKVSLLLYFVS